MKISLRGRIWGIALSVALFFFVLPVYGAIILSSISYELENGFITKEAEIIRFGNSVLCSGNLLLFFITVVLAVCLGGGFSYLFSKQKVDLYHALPVKRNILYWANYITGVVVYIIPYLVFMLITIVIGKSFGVMTSEWIMRAFWMFAINIAAFILIYSVTVVAKMLTGTTPVSVMGTVVLLLYGMIASAIFEMMMSNLYYTYCGPTGNGMGGTGLIYFLSPIYDYTKAGSYLQEFPTSMFLGMLVAGIVLAFAAALLYKFRASESACSAMAFKKSMLGIAILITVPVSAFGAISCNYITSNSTMGYGWLIFGMLVTLILCHVIIQAIYYGDFKALLKNPLNLLVSGVAVAVIFLVMIMDLTGYNSYFPKESEFESAAVTSYSLHSNLSYYNFDKEVDYLGECDTWVDTNLYRLDKMVITDYNVLKEFIDVAKADSAIYNESTDNNSENEGLCEFVVKYRTKFGKDKVRKYYVDLKKHFDEYAKLFNSVEYKNAVYPILTIDDSRKNNLTVETGIASVVLKDMSEEAAWELINTYQDELINMDATEIRDSVPVCCIYHNETRVENGIKNKYRSYDAPVYPSFTKTIALLEEQGIDVYGYRDISNIDHIEVTNYHYDDTYNAEGMAREGMEYEAVEYDSEDNTDTVIYSSPEDIQMIVDAASPNNFVYFDGIFHETASIDVNVYYKEYPASQSSGSCYWTFDKGKVPEKVCQDVKYRQ